MAAHIGAGFLVSLPNTQPHELVKPILTGENDIGELRTGQLGHQRYSVSLEKNSKTQIISLDFSCVFLRLPPTKEVVKQLNHYLKFGFNHVTLDLTTYPRYRRRFGIIDTDTFEKCTQYIKNNHALTCLSLKLHFCGKFGQQFIGCLQDHPSLTRLTLHCLSSDELNITCLKTTLCSMKALQSLTLINFESSNVEQIVHSAHLQQLA